ncbi:ranBP-type and C3HC4-type zinc finger-containing protein 1-like [Rhopilema esculentum]|uniref:ranBP-type and C3HC4-type zinc finger-containing protein 1-like n=1 Tax=Rhopilema esculentum TaxID=499914 RepID=UPI0031DAFFA4
MMSWNKLLSCKGTVHRYDLSKNTFEPLVRDLCEIQVWVFHNGGTGRQLGEVKVVTGSNNQILRLQLSKVIALHPPPLQEPSWFVLELDMAVCFEKYGLKIADTKQNIQSFGNLLHRLMDQKDGRIPPEANNDIYAPPSNVQQAPPIYYRKIESNVPFPADGSSFSDCHTYDKLNLQPQHFAPLRRVNPTSFPLHGDKDYVSMHGGSPQVSEDLDNHYESILTYQNPTLVSPVNRKVPELPARPPRLQSGITQTQTLAAMETPAQGPRRMLIPISPEINMEKDENVSSKKISVADAQTSNKNPDSVEKPAFDCDNADFLCDMLAEAIDVGNTVQAANIAEKLAKQKLKITIQALFSETDEKPPECTINITVQVEDKESETPTLIKLDVDPNCSIGKLKYMVQQLFGFPIKVQRWVIGKRLPKDVESLKQLNVITTGTVIFLYLLSAKEVGIDKTNLSLQDPKNSQSSDKFQLPPRDYSPGTNLNGPPELNAARQQYPSAPAASPRNSPFPNPAGQDFVMPPSLQPSAQNKNSPRNYFQDFYGTPPPFNPPYQNVNNPQGRYGRPGPPVPPVLSSTSSHIPDATARKSATQKALIAQQKSIMKKTGWTCPRCTFINPPTRPGCAACTATRPIDYKIPADFEVDDSERRRLEEEYMLEQMAFNFEESREEQDRKLAAENYLQVLATAQKNLIPNTEEFECPICFTPIEPNEGILLRECLHSFCKVCLKMHINQSDDPEVKCPFTDGTVNCPEVITAQEISSILNEEEYMNYLQRSVNAAENRAPNSYHCKTLNCNGWCFYEDEVNWFDCQVCNKRNCLTCKAIHLNMTCQQYQDDLKIKSENDVAARRTQEMLEELVRKGDAMNCPQCAIILQKKDGCDWMRCSMCKTEICWATKGRRWGPKGNGDTTGGCQCTPAKRCHPNCGNCH